MTMCHWARVFHVIGILRTANGFEEAACSCRSLRAKLLSQGRTFLVITISCATRTMRSIQEHGQAKFGQSDWPRRRGVSALLLAVQNSQATAWAVGDALLLAVSALQHMIMWSSREFARLHTARQRFFSSTDLRDDLWRVSGLCPAGAVLAS